MSSRVWLIGVVALAVSGCGTDEGDSPMADGVEDVQEASADVPDSSDEVSDVGPACLEGADPILSEEVLAGYPQCTEEELGLNACGSKVNALDIGAAGNPGEGMDIDLDPSTCAPAGDSLIVINFVLKIINI